MDLKIEQYRKGEQFVRAIAARRGARALRRLWDGPRPFHGKARSTHPTAGSARVLDAAPRAEPARDRLGRPASRPGSGQGGAPTAIALSPILSARYRSRDLERIRAAARAPAS
jgi:hypothetical protein